VKPESSGDAKTEHDDGPQRAASFRREVLIPSNVQVVEIDVESLAEILEELYGILSVHAEVLGNPTFKAKMVPTRYWPAMSYKSKAIFF
jgi:hypothetical protein